MMLCASCGIAEVDDIKLKECDDCDLVRYCSDACQELHRPEHAGKCRKRAAELRDEILFKQPESNHFGDCPICCLPVPIDEQQTVFMTCCSKRICLGCIYTNQEREIKGRLQQKCPFCREPAPDRYEEHNRRLMKRIEANDPAAMCEMGADIYNEGHYDSAFKYYSRAAALGNVLAHYHLSTSYREGQGVEKNEKKHVYHAEKAAIAGHPEARYNLGCTEEQRGSFDRAAKHYIIAAKLGDDDSLRRVKDLYQSGIVNKDDFTAALRGYQTAINATKSPQREEAAEYAKCHLSSERGSR